VEKDLYSAIVGLCVEPGKICMQDMMAIDHSGMHESAAVPAPVDRSPLRGAGLPNPAIKSDRPLVVDATTPSSR
jgi:cytochrome o ubiquinol oxidase subunit 2